MQIKAEWGDASTSQDTRMASKPLEASSQVKAWTRPSLTAASGGTSLALVLDFRALKQ